MISHPSQVGKFAAALTLLSDEIVGISVLPNDSIQVTHANGRHIFNSEYDLILWLQEQMIDSLSANLSWLKEHKP